jgi:hypothetical protein
MRQLPLVFLLLATALRAEDAPREIFPADFTPSPCALETSCISFPDSSMKSAAFQFLFLELDANWAEKHAPEMKAAIAPLCRKHATCQTYPMNTYTFCDDVLAADARPLCEKMFPRSKNGHDWEQCSQWLETYLMGVDQNAINTWKAAQACATKQPPATHMKPLDTWMSPTPVPYDYKGYVTFYSIDPDTHVPVLARVTFEDQILYAEANPTGQSATYYPMKLPFKYVRVPNAEGHTDAATPRVTIKASGYPETTFRLPAVLPRAVVEMKPAPSALHAGKNEVTVLARDSINGKPVDGRVMLGDDEVGFANQPITIEVKPKSKRPELWLRPYLNRYSDVVIAPAER